MQRYHINTAAAAAAAGTSAASASATADWAASLRGVTAALVAAAPSVSGATVYTGAAGVAYALARAARGPAVDGDGASPPPAALLREAARLSRAAAAHPGLRRRPRESVMDGAAGVAAVEAIVARCAPVRAVCCA